MAKMDIQIVKKEGKEGATKGPRRVYINYVEGTPGYEAVKKLNAANVNVALTLEPTLVDLAGRQ